MFKEQICEYIRNHNVWKKVREAFSSSVLTIVYFQEIYCTLWKFNLQKCNTRLDICNIFLGYYTSLIFDWPSFMSYCRKYFLCTKLLFTSFILLEFLRSTNLVMCTGMFFAMPTVQASQNLAEFVHKWNNFILPFQADTKFVWNGMTFMNCIKNIILHLNKEVHNLNNISIAILYSVFTVYFGSEICR